MGIRDSLAVLRAREYQPKQIPIQHGLVGFYIPAWGSDGFDNHDREGDWVEVLRRAWHGTWISFSPFRSLIAALFVKRTFWTLAVVIGVCTTDEQLSLRSFLSV